MGRPRKKNHEVREGFGTRARELRERLSSSLGISTVIDYLEWLGLRPGTYYPWERDNCVPSLTDIACDFLNARDKRGRRITECPSLLCWLATGEDAYKPSWFDDHRLDPFEATASDTPDPGGGGPGTVVQFDAAVRELLGARVAPIVRRAVSDAMNDVRPDLPLVLRTAGEFEAFLRTLVQPAPSTATADRLSPGSKCRLRSPVPAARPVQRIIKPDDTAVA